MPIHHVWLIGREQQSMSHTGRSGVVLVCALLGTTAACTRQAAADPPSKMQAAPAATPPRLGVPARDRPRPTYRKAVVHVQAEDGEQRLDVEVAENDPQRMHGLMFTESLLDTQGMIFVFQESSVHWFWMKNTLIPLDMVFIGDDRKVVGVHENATPLSLARMGVNAASRYVLEVNSGWCRRHGVKAGTQLRFEGVE